MSEQDESYLDALLNSLTSSDEPDSIEEPEEVNEPEVVEEAEEVVQPEELEAPEVPEDFPVDIISDENGEDLTELLGMLAEHYEEEQGIQEKITENIDDSSVGMADIFQESLDAVAYMENEEEDPFVALDEESSLAESEEVLAEDEDIPVGSEMMESAFPLEEEIPLPVEVAPKEKKKEKKSFKERFFNNIVDDKEVEKELAAKEAEMAAFETRQAKAEEKKKLDAQKKEEKEKLQLEKKEKKELEKATKQAEKQKKKEMKAQERALRAEEEAREFVGRINPIGAAIVCAFSLDKSYKYE